MRKLCEEVLQDVRTGNRLSAIFPSALVLAKKAGNVQLENWLLLEMNGYYTGNSAMAEDTVVPEYRSVPGRWHDIYGRPFIIDEPALMNIDYEIRCPILKNYLGTRCISSSQMQSSQAR